MQIFLKCLERSLFKLTPSTNCSFDMLELMLMSTLNKLQQFDYYTPKFKRHIVILI